MRSYRPCHRRLWDRAGRAGPSLPRHLGNVDHVRTAVLRAEKPSAGCAEPVPRAAEPRGREAPKLARIDRAAVRPYGGAADGCLRPILAARPRQPAEQAVAGPAGRERHGIALERREATIEHAVVPIAAKRSADRGAPGLVVPCRSPGLRHTRDVEVTRRIIDLRGIVGRDVAKCGGRILSALELSTGVVEDLGIRLLRLGSATDLARCLPAPFAWQ